MFFTVLERSTYSQRIKFLPEELYSKFVFYKNNFFINKIIFLNGYIKIKIYRQIK